MDISNYTSVNQQVPSVVKPISEAVSQNSAAKGKVLPLPEKEVTSSEKLQGDGEAAKSIDELREMVAEANESPAVRSSNLRFSMAEGTDISVVRIEDSQTGELIRQIPSEQMVELSRTLEEQRQGMMLEEEV